MRQATFRWFSLFLIVALSGCVGSFSPDGKKIAFLDQDGPVVINVDGSSYKRLWRGYARGSASFSPDGKNILFVKGKKGKGIYNKQSLSVYNLQSAKIQEVNIGFRSIEGVLAWRPDGKQFAVAGHVIDKEGRWDGRTEVRLFNWPSGILARRFKPPHSPGSLMTQPLVWLSSSDDLVFLAGVGGSNVYRFTSGRVSRVTTTNDVIGMSFLPKTNRLIWARSIGKMAVFHSLDLKTRKLNKLRFAPKFAFGKQKLQSIDAVSFSPDGKQVLTYATLVTRRKTKTRPEVTRMVCHAMALDGRNVHFLHRSAPTIHPLSEKEDWGPTAFIAANWARNSRQVAITLFNKNSRQLWVCKNDGSGKKLLWPAKKKL